MNTREVLQLRYKAVLQSESDSRFYLNVYKYIDIIMKNKQLSSIIDKSAEIYRERHADIWHPHTSEESEIRERSRQTYKLEMFNLYTADFTSLYVRIYRPIEDYINSVEPDSRQDPLALLMLFGIKSHRTKFWANNARSMPPKAAMHSLKSYNRWYDKKNKEQYKEDLNNFHTDFLTAVAQQTSDSEPTTKSFTDIPLQIDPRTGDFSYYGFRDTFNTKEKAFKVLNHLLNADGYFSEYPDLISTYRPYRKESATSQHAELNQVIKKIKEKLNILPESEFSNVDIFENSKGVGYRLVFPI